MNKADEVPALRKLASAEVKFNRYNKQNRHDVWTHALENGGATLYQVAGEGFPEKVVFMCFMKLITN